MADKHVTRLMLMTLNGDHRPLSGPSSYFCIYLKDKVTPKNGIIIKISHNSLTPHADGKLDEVHKSFLELRSKAASHCSKQLNQMGTCFKMWEIKMKNNLKWSHTVHLVLSESLEDPTLI